MWGGGSQAAPPVRKLARELGVDPRHLAGSGPGRAGSTASDVHAGRGNDRAAYTATARDTPEVVTGEGARAIARHRRAMARNMAEAWRTVPHVSLFDEIDAPPAAARALWPGGAVGIPTRLTLTAFFVRASVLALGANPSSTRASTRPLTRSCTTSAINVGVAVASDDGLVVPVVHDAESLGLRALGDEISRMTAAAAGGLPPDEIRGATFTVTNFGTEGGRFATPSSAHHRWRSSGAVQSAPSLSSTATTSSPRPVRSPSPCRPTTVWSTVTKRRRSSTRSPPAARGRCTSSPTAEAVKRQEARSARAFTVDSVSTMHLTKVELLGRRPECVGATPCSSSVPFQLGASRNHHCTSSCSAPPSNDRSDVHASSRGSSATSIRISRSSP